MFTSRSELWKAWNRQPHFDVPPRSLALPSMNRAFASSRSSLLAPWLVKNKCIRGALYRRCIYASSVLLHDNPLVCFLYFQLVRGYPLTGIYLRDFQRNPMAHPSRYPESQDHHRNGEYLMSRRWSSLQVERAASGKAQLQACKSYVVSVTVSITR